MLSNLEHEHNGATICLSQAEFDVRALLAAPSPMGDAVLRRASKLQSKRARDGAQSRAPGGASFLDSNYSKPSRTGPILGSGYASSANP